MFTARPEAPESRSMGLPRTQLLSISPSGELAVQLNSQQIGTWVNTGTLARAPLVGGAPREVLERVQWADWSPGGNLAVVRDLEGQNRLEMPVGTVLYRTGGWIGHPRVSRQGDKVAFIDHPIQGDDSGSIAVVDLEGQEDGPHRRLVHDPGPGLVGGRLRGLVHGQQDRGRPHHLRGGPLRTPAADRARAGHPHAPRHLSGWPGAHDALELAARAGRGSSRGTPATTTCRGSTTRTPPT